MALADQKVHACICRRYAVPLQNLHTIKPQNRHRIVLTEKYKHGYPFSNQCSHIVHRFFPSLSTGSFPYYETSVFFIHLHQTSLDIRHLALMHLLPILQSSNSFLQFDDLLIFRLQVCTRRLPA